MGQQKTQWSSKKTVQPQTSGGKDKYPFPSRYGSHSSMVDQEATMQLNNEKLVICKDENGWYVTEKNRLDQRIADANRYGSNHARDMQFWGVEREQPKPVDLPVERTE